MIFKEDDKTMVEKFMKHSQNIAIKENVERNKFLSRLHSEADKNSPFDLLGVIRETRYDCIYGPSRNFYTYWAYCNDMDGNNFQYNNDPNPATRLYNNTVLCFVQYELITCFSNRFRTVFKYVCKGLNLRKNMDLFDPIQRELSKHLIIGDYDYPTDERHDNDIILFSVVHTPKSDHDGEAMRRDNACYMYVIIDSDEKRELFKRFLLED